MDRVSICFAAAIMAPVLGAAVLYSHLHPVMHRQNVDLVNSLFVIAPYKYQGMWVFDDPAVGLTKEPFIAGIDTMIDRITADLPNAEGGFRAVFSARPFPGAQHKLEWKRGESGGNWYHSDDYKMEGWLCPALFKYFPDAPREIYIRVEPKT